MKGLDQFLAKIRETPRATLISRYLSLVAEMQDEGEKATRALDLAESLVQARPAETLRLAHMVFGADRTNLRAIDLMIAAMISRGRPGKAEVLRLERAKIEQELAANPVREASARLPQALFDPVVDQEVGDRHRQEGTFSRIAEIDLGPLSDRNDPYGAGPLPADALAIDRSPPPARELALELPLDMAALPNLAAPANTEREPVEFDFLAGLFPSDSNTTVSPLPTPTPARPVAPEPLKMPVAKAVAPGKAAAPQKSGNPMRSETVVSSVAMQLNMLEGMPDHKPVDTVLPGGLALSSTPDQLAPTLHLDAASLKDSVRLDSPPSPSCEPVARVAPSAPEVEDHDDDPVLASTKSESFWLSMQKEIGRLAQHGPGESKREVVPSKGSAALPDSLFRQLRELDHAKPEVLALKWSFVQSLFCASGRVDPRVVQALEILGLTEATPGFFGCYLDGLLAAGRARRAAHELRRILASKPHLAWAHVAWARLPRLWELQRVHGFVWHEDEGVPSLLAKLRQRPTPKLQALVVGTRRAS